MADRIVVIYFMQIDLHQDSLFIKCIQAFPLNYVLELSLDVFMIIYMFTCTKTFFKALKRFPTLDGCVEACWCMFKVHKITMHSLN